jgi:hypothetical protein
MLCCEWNLQFGGFQVEKNRETLDAIKIFNLKEE